MADDGVTQEQPRSFNRDLLEVHLHIQGLPPKCPERDHEYALRQRCHPDAGCRAFYRDGRVLLACEECDTTYAQLELAQGH